MTQPQLTLSSARDDLRTEPRPVRAVIIAMALIFLTVFVILPLVVVFAQAFSKGVGAYFAALSDPEALSAIRLTLGVAAISVSLNLVFGLVAAWAIAKFDFRGKTFLISLIDLPFSVSPVISGLVFVLLFGAQGYWGPWLQSHDIHVLFAVPGIALATIFVTFPFVAARADSADAGTGNAGGGGRDLARCVRPADLLPRHSAEYQMGRALWCAAVQRARDGRIRRGVGGVGAYPRRDQYHAAIGRDSLQ